MISKDTWLAPAAIFVWNAIGLYPNAGQDFYYMGSPIFSCSTIDLGTGRKFTIEALNASGANKYVQSATLDGKPIDRAWLKHSEISKGGNLVLQMSDRASNWASAQRPPAVSSKSQPSARNDASAADGESKR